ncbi:hypothetical protein AI2624V1_4775 (plasmid) [Enterobacter cloacae]|nr:hypothetical protein AI2624V1_4775 [Enterobacter cloacae]CAH5348802.1 hypothetical protein AI2624V1_4775 [Enterobacter cloacae]
MKELSDVILHYRVLIMNQKLKAAEKLHTTYILKMG